MNRILLLIIVLLSVLVNINAVNITNTLPASINTYTINNLFDYITCSDADDCYIYIDAQNKSNNYTSDGTLFNPSSFTNPDNAFDGNLSSYASKSVTPGSAVALGKTFDETNILNVSYKVRKDGNGNFACSYILQKYIDGVWSNFYTVYSGLCPVGDIDYEGSTLLNETVEGIRLYVTNSISASSNLDPFVFNLGWEDYGIVFTSAGNKSYTIYASNSTTEINETGSIYVNPTQYIYFQSSLGEELTNFSINGTLYDEYFNFSLYDYGVGIHTFNFSKSGFVDTLFDVILTDTSEINTTEIIITSSVAMYVYSFPSLNPLVFNLSVEYNSTIDTYLNQNASIFFTYPDVPLGINRFVFSAPGYSENVLYQDIEATTDINISVYMFNSSATSTVTYTVQDVGGTALEGVLIEAQRIINSTYETISQTLTDASGSSFMLLDNTVSYKIILTKDGYVETVFYTIPSVDTYTIKMSEDEDEYEYVRDISYSFRPATNLINSNTTYSFSGFISGSGITVSAYTLYYDNGTILYSDSSTNPTGTTFSISYTTPSNFSTDYLYANITYIKSGVTYNIMKQYELLDFNSDTVIGNLMVFGDDDTEEAQLTKWFILMAVSVIVFVIGAVFSSNISLLIVPVYAFFAYIGWIDWIIAAVAIFITLVVFVGGKVR